MDRDEFVDFLLRQYRLVDAYWFLAVEKKYGLDAAVELNEDVWETLAGKTAREIKRRFKLKRKGLKGFVEALQYYPWTRITNYVIEETEDKVIIRVPSCPPQEGRKKMGLREFPCKMMHLKDFASFAKEIDPDIEVKCLYAPPDEHPKGCYCEWEFVLKK
ncbi:MAG: hypothetical protein JW724_04775 [Candidatus Altiarchaeota archaeon]|nr:hypothetical protein [Candidatus Altiarchaeota archaeon]